MVSMTKGKIAQTFLDLAQKKSLQKISVSEIVEGAGISRGTFYHHFVDIQDLINWIYHQEVTIPFREAIASEDETTADLSLIYVQALYQRRDFYCQAFRMEGMGTLTDFARREIKENWRLYVERLAEKAKINDAAHMQQMKTITDMIALGSFNSLVEWACKGMLIPPRQLCQDMDQTILPFLKKAFPKGDIS